MTPGEQAFDGDARGPTDQQAAEHSALLQGAGVRFVRVDDRGVIMQASPGWLEDGSSPVGWGLEGLLVGGQEARLAGVFERARNAPCGRASGAVRFAAGADGQPRTFWCTASAPGEGPGMWLVACDVTGALGSGARGADAKPEAELTTTTPDIDWAALAALCEGDEELIDELCKTFDECSRESLARIEANLARGSETDVVDSLQYLKGSARSLQATHLANVCTHMASVVRDGDLSPCKAVLPALRDALNRLRKLFEHRL